MFLYSPEVANAGLALSITATSAVRTEVLVIIVSFRNGGLLNPPVRLSTSGCRTKYAYC
jgi:hypothetical protein